MTSGIEAGVVLQPGGEAAGSPPPHLENRPHCTLERRERERAVQRNRWGVLLCFRQHNIAKC